MFVTGIAFDELTRFGLRDREPPLLPHLGSGEGDLVSPEGSMCVRMILSSLSFPCSFSRSFSRETWDRSDSSSPRSMASADRFASARFDENVDIFRYTDGDPRCGFTLRLAGPGEGELQSSSTLEIADNFLMPES